MGMRQIVTIGLWMGLATACQAQFSCPASPSGAQGKSFTGQNLINANFAGQDLTNADFSGAAIAGAYFGGATLTGAKFTGATITASSPEAPTDFSFANLDSACFINVHFSGTTYFTYSTITCADFSNVDLSNNNAIFGDAFVVDTGRSCRPTFRSATMNCEFVDQWKSMNLTGAAIHGCYSALAGKDFSGTVMEGVSFQNAVLDGAKFIKADLTGVNLNRTSLQGADLSYATLFGAQINNANLTGANLYHAFLANNNQGHISQSASVTNSHLKNANLSFAELSGVHFTLSNFYGDTAAGAGTCSTTGANYEGFTCGCASAHGATMIGTMFDQAYLFGTDFSDSTGTGVNFFEAILVGSSFAGATLGVNTDTGAVTSLNRAFLQGAALATAKLTNVNLTDAFLDFTAGGNNIYIYLDGTNHNDFACSPGTPCSPASGQPVCVEVNYTSPTTANTADPTMTCPDGSTGNCGALDPAGANTKWASSITDIGNPPSGVAPAWYDQNATYTKAPTDQSVICKGSGANSSIVLW